MEDKININPKAIDICIPVAPKDYHKLQRCIEGVTKFCLNEINNIYLICKDEDVLKFICRENQGQNHSIVLVLEESFPFTKKDIEKILNSEKKHGSWYYQQLLKFYVFNVIPCLNEHVLILDSDLTIKSNVEYLNGEGQALLSYGYPFKWLIGTLNYPPPSDVVHIHTLHAKKLVPGWEVMDSYSGMHHHMLFNKIIINDLFDRVERFWGEPFWKSFLNAVDNTIWNAGSEYVIYYHFSKKFHSEKVVSRHLSTCDVIYDENDDEVVSSDSQKLLDETNLDAFGSHGFVCLNDRLHTMEYITEETRKWMIDSKARKYLLFLQNGKLFIKINKS